MMALQQNFISTKVFISFKCFNVSLKVSSELAPVHFDVYDSWGKLDTVDVASRTEIISTIYKKSDRPISRLNLDYKMDTTNS